MAAAIAIINYEGKILIGKKRSDSKKFLAGKWHLPGETLEKGETEEQALIRGIKEETGLDIVVGKYLASHITPTSKAEVKWFECFAKSKDAIPSSDLEKLRWVEKKEVPIICELSSHIWPKEIDDYFN